MLHQTTNTTSMRCWRLIRGVFIGVALVLLSLLIAGALLEATKAQSASFSSSSSSSSASLLVLSHTSAPPVPHESSAAASSSFSSSDDDSFVDAVQQHHHHHHRRRRRRDADHDVSPLLQFAARTYVFESTVFKRAIEYLELELRNVIQLIPHVQDVLVQLMYSPQEQEQEQHLMHESLPLVSLNGADNSANIEWRLPKLRLASAVNWSSSSPQTAFIAFNTGFARAHLQYQQHRDPANLALSSYSFSGKANIRSKVHISSESPNSFGYLRLESLLAHEPRPTSTAKTEDAIDEGSHARFLALIATVALAQSSVIRSKLSAFEGAVSKWVTSAFEVVESSTFESGLLFSAASLERQVPLLPQRLHLVAAARDSDGAFVLHFDRMSLPLKTWQIALKSSPSKLKMAALKEAHLQNGRISLRFIREFPFVSASLSAAALVDLEVDSEAGSAAAAADDGDDIAVADNREQQQQQQQPPPLQEDGSIWTRFLQNSVQALLRSRDREADEELLMRIIREALIDQPNIQLNEQESHLSVDSEDIAALPSFRLMQVSKKRATMVIDCSLKGTRLSLDLLLNGHSTAITAEVSNVHVSGELELLVMNGDDDDNVDASLCFSERPQVSYSLGINEKGWSALIWSLPVLAAKHLFVDKMLNKLIDDLHPLCVRTQDLQALL